MGIMVYGAARAFFSCSLLVLLCRTAKFNTAETSLRYRRVLKKGDLNTPSACPIFQKENGGFDFQFKTAVRRTVLCFGA